MEWFSRTQSSDDISSHEVNSGKAGETVFTEPDEKRQTSVDAQVLQDVKQLGKAHQADPNLADDEIDALQEAAKTGDAEKVLEVERAFVEDSPYENVRAAVRTTDGEEEANTLRAWVLGFFFVTVASGINMFLSMRSPASMSLCKCKIMTLECLSIRV
jgi:hypothetical protein